MGQYIPVILAGFSAFLPLLLEWMIAEAEMIITAERKLSRGIKAIDFTKGTIDEAVEKCPTAEKVLVGKARTNTVY